MKKKFSFAIILFAAGILVAAAVSVRAVQEAYRSRKIEKEVEALKRQAQEIQNENDTIQKQIDYYSTPEFVERISKDKMNMQKPDEKVVVVNQSAASQAQNAEDQAEEVQTDRNMSNYRKWWDFFFKYD